MLRFGLSSLAINRKNLSHVYCSYQSIWHFPSMSTWKCIEKETNQQTWAKGFAKPFILFRGDWKKILPNVLVCYNSSNSGIVPVEFVWFSMHRSLYCNTCTYKTPPNEMMTNDRPYSVCELLFRLPKIQIHSLFDDALHSALLCICSFQLAQDSTDEHEAENETNIYVNEQTQNLLRLLTDQVIRMKFAFNQWAK